MADQETKDAIQDTAIAVVQAQQQVVGAGVVGAGVATLGPVQSDRDTDLLQQIRDFGKKSVDALKNAVGVFTSLLTFEKNEARIAREQQAEKDKELKGKETDGNISANLGDVFADENLDVANKVGALAFMGNFLGNLPGVGLIKKILAPIGAFFGKGGFIFRIFGRFGPLAVLAGGIFLIARYADDIAKAFAPVIDKLKGLVTALTPFFQNTLLPFVDFVFKNLIQGLANVMDFVINTITNIVEGIKKIFSGDIGAGLSQLLDGLMGVIFAIPVMIFNFLKPMFLGIVDFFEEGFQNFTQGIRDFFSNIFSAIGGFIMNYINFVKDKVITLVTAPIQFFKDIFSFITNVYSNILTSVNEFLGGIPGKILGGVMSLFAPIIDFFKSIGNKIKSAINAIIDALPLPKSLKNKMKFEIEEEPAQLDTAGTGDAAIAEKIAKDNRMGIDQIGKYKFVNGVLQINGKDFSHPGDEIAKSYVDEIGEAVKLAMDSRGNYTVVKSDMPLKPNDFKMTSMGQEQDDNVLFGTEPLVAGKTKNLAKSIPMSDSGAGATFVNQPITKIDNSSSNSQTSVNTGKLQVAIDPYHDRNAVSEYF